MKNNGLELEVRSYSNCTPKLYLDSDSFTTSFKSAYYKNSIMFSREDLSAVNGPARSNSGGVSPQWYIMYYSFFTNMQIPGSSGVVLSVLEHQRLYVRFLEKIPCILCYSAATKVATNSLSYHYYISCQF